MISSVGKLENKTVLTGACSTGLGVEIARLILTTYVILFLTARSLARARASLGEVTKSPLI